MILSPKTPPPKPVDQYHIVLTYDEITRLLTWFGVLERAGKSDQRDVELMCKLAQTEKAWKF